jgi:hypothetical protein
LIVWDEPTITTMNTDLMKDPVETLTLNMAEINADSE